MFYIYWRGMYQIDFPTLEEANNYIFSSRNTNFDDYTIEERTF